MSASNNDPSYPYQQRPPHQGQTASQSFQQGPQGSRYGRGATAEYYVASQQAFEQHRQQHPQIPGLNMSTSNSRPTPRPAPRDPLIGAPASTSTSAPQAPALTAAANPAPSQHRQDFNDGYTASYTIAAHVQNYQPPTTTTDMSHVSSGNAPRARTVTAPTTYPQYQTHFTPSAASLSSSTQLRTPTDTYYNYPAATTSAVAYDSLYQTADTAPRPAQNYTPVYQPEPTRQVPTQGAYTVYQAGTHGYQYQAGEGQQYQGGVTVKSQGKEQVATQQQVAAQQQVAQQQQQQQQRQQQQAQKERQQQERQQERQQAQQQAQQQKLHMQTQHTQHQALVQQSQQRQQSAQQQRQQLQSQAEIQHKALAQQQGLQPQQVFQHQPHPHPQSQPQPKTFSPPLAYRTTTLTAGAQRTQSSAPVASESYTSAPPYISQPQPRPQPQHAAKPKPKPKSKPISSSNIGTTIKTWTSPAEAPPQPKIVGTIRDQLAAWEEQDTMIAQNLARLEARQEAPWAQGQQVPRQLQVRKETQPSQGWSAPPSQEKPQYHHHVIPTPQTQFPHHTPPTLVLPPQPTLQPPPQTPQPQAQSQYQPQRVPEPQYTPPPQPAPRQEPATQPQDLPPPPPRAPSEPRPVPPLNRDLMEHQMRLMVERMRYYQAADPVTFQSVWDNVRKNGGGGGNSITAGEERRAIMPVAAGMVRSESTTSDQAVVYTPSQTSQIEVPEVKNMTPRQEPVQAPILAPIPAPVPAQIPVEPQQQQQQQQQQQPPPQLQPEPQSRPPQVSKQENALHRRTAKAVSKYLTQTSGHCLPEEVIVDLLNRIKSFPILCDKLEAMGYQFHRGSFSRFLLAEVDGRSGEAPEEVTPKIDQKNVAVEAADNGGSRVLGEVGDDQEQIMREFNEAREAAAVSEHEVEVLAQPVRKPRGKSVKPIDTQKSTNAVAPKTPPVFSTQQTTLPTPMSIAPTALMKPGPVAQIEAPLSTPSTKKPSLGAHNSAYTGLPAEQQSPSPNIDYIQRHPTPQSVKVAHTTPPQDSEMKQFVSPSLVYRPPTPPLVIEAESSASPPVEETTCPGMDIEMRDESPQQEEARYPRKLTKIVKLRLKNLAWGQTIPMPVPVPVPVPATMPVPAPTPTPVDRDVGRVIDLTSATPEPQMIREPASAPDPRAKPAGAPQIERPIPVPQTAPAGASTQDDFVLFKSVSQREPLRKFRYNPLTIAHDIQVAVGRNPQFVRPLNEHLESLRLRGILTLDTDLETVRWDLLDPGPGSMGFAAGYDAGIDDDDDGTYGDVGGVRVGASFRSGDLVGMKGVGGEFAPTPTPAARGRGRGRTKKWVPGTSVMDIQDAGMGVTTASNGVAGGSRRQSATTGNGNGNSNGSARTNGSGVSWGGFSVPTPRSGSRTSGLRNVATPDGSGGGGNFAIVIRSPSASSIDRSRAPESTGGRGLKRPLDGNERETGTPPPKKPAKTKSSRKSKDQEPPELKPSGFKVFKCRWRKCPSELHNFTTLQRHVIKAHCKPTDNGSYPCHWEGCSKSPSKEMKAAAAKGPGKVVVQRGSWEFSNPEQWEKHVLELHLESIKNEIGVGPFIGPYDHEAVGSDADYLSDSFGRQVTPIARLAPRGHVFLPPPGYEASPAHSAMNRHIQRARSLGAGMEGDETADLMENDDGQGVFAVVRRIVSAEDRVVDVQEGVKSEGAKGKSKGKGKEKAVEKKVVEAEPGGDIGVGAFTVYDEEFYI